VVSLNQAKESKSKLNCNRENARGIPPPGISLKAAMIAALLLFHNTNWREVISLSPSEIEQWAKAIRDRK
jgi:hypothetical protein